MKIFATIILAVGALLLGSYLLGAGGDRYTFNAAIGLMIFAGVLNSIWGGDKATAG